MITTARFGDDIDPRIFSRMQDQRLCKVFAISVLTYRGLPAPEGEKPHRRKRQPGSGLTH